jgi:cytochrome c peroxidase
MSRSGFIIAFFLIVFGCKKEEIPGTSSAATPYPFTSPANLPAAEIPANNPMTYEGIKLGKKLFYDKLLSGNNTLSCGSCHNQENGFTDNNKQFSLGTNGEIGVRNSMPLFNLVYDRHFFWDGGASDLESQVAGPITNPIEMNQDIAELLQELNSHAEYPSLFKKAFGSLPITSNMVLKAIAQFERTMISSNSKFDKYMRNEVAFTEAETRGMNLFNDMQKGDCNHCHTLGGTFTDYDFRNTGLDSVYTDQGRFIITGLASDIGKFKTPSLRNIAVTAPYMHDGRFTTLTQCVEHYNTGFHNTQNLDPVLASSVKGRLNQNEISDIVAFLNTLTDTDFLNNPQFKKP